MKVILVVGRMAALDLQIASRTIIRWSIVSEKVALMQNKDVKMKDAIVDSAQKQTKKSEKKVVKSSISAILFSILLI